MGVRSDLVSYARTVVELAQSIVDEDGDVDVYELQTTTNQLSDAAEEIRFRAQILFDRQWEVSQ